MHQLSLGCWIGIMAKLILLLLVAASQGLAGPLTSHPSRICNMLLQHSIAKSSMLVLQAAYEEAEDKNIVSSPLGLMILLSLYTSVGKGEAEQELNYLLGLRGLELPSMSYQNLSNELSNVDTMHFALANEVFVSNAYTPTVEFSAAAKAYGSEVSTLDFTKPADAAAVINQWAAEKTKGLIKDPVSEDVLSEDVAAMLVNVIFFQGHWHVPFNASETKETDFHVDKNTIVKKPMMHLLQPLHYAESEKLGAKMISLPYQETGFRMVIVLPNEVDGLSAVLHKAAETGLLDIFGVGPVNRDVDLDMPKFEIESFLNYKNILPKIGVSKIFTEGAPGIVNEKPVKISDVFQKALIKVDEEGATAGAFTGMVAVPMSSNSKPPAPIVFKVDHPFMYVILYKNKILFTGTYTK